MITYGLRRKACTDLELLVGLDSANLTKASFTKPVQEVTIRLRGGLTAAAFSWS
jgi:hypothetical protein